MEKIKVALVHDWLTGRRGGEKVLEVLAEMFPEAPIYTLFHFRGTQAEDVERRRVVTSFLQKCPCVRTKYRSYLPLFPLAVEMFDLQEFDLVISSSHCVAKGVIPRPDALHISYVHSPVRYAWNQYFSYFAPEKLGPFSRLLIPPTIHYLRLWDESSSHRVDHFIANSENVAGRIRKYYRREAAVIHPPVDTDFFIPEEEGRREDYYLLVSALVPYKRIDLAIAAFNRRGSALRVVGVGPEYKHLKKTAKANIQFLGNLSAEDLRRAYQRARALLMPGEEDFGIAAMEAQACGTPVLAYGRGGAVETVLPGETGVFFSELRISDFLEALDKLEGMEFNKSILRSHALRFSRENFREKMSDFSRRKWEEFRSRE